MDVPYNENSGDFSLLENLNMKKRRYYIIASAIIISVAIALYYWHSIQPKRISRQHTKEVASEFEYLTNRIGLNKSRLSNHKYTAEKAEGDLDEIEWLLENRYSYLKLKGVDYKAALDSIRSSLGKKIRRGDLGCQLTKMLALFGDGHSSVRSSSIRLKSLCTKFLPFLIEQSNGRLLAVKPDRSGFIDKDFPFLRKMDGLDINIWLKQASEYVADGSPQFVRHNSIRNLRHVEVLRIELGLSKSPSLNIELESADGTLTKQIQLPLNDERPEYGFLPPLEKEIESITDIHPESRILEGNIGYLRIAFMLQEPAFLEEIIESMANLAKTDALIIDVRGNPGGSRAPLRTLFPFFMAKDESPAVLNIAAYRLGHRKNILDARWLYPENWKGWSVEEKAAIAKTAKTFQPQWQLPQEDFSKWHYFVISPSQSRQYYHYDRPVIILMNGRNFSASDIFLGAFKGRTGITLVGTPSGGGSGRKQNYRLRHSSIQISLSSMASFQTNGNLYDGNGIQPDIMIEPIPTDFIGQTDSVLQTACNMIKPQIKK